MANKFDSTVLPQTNTPTEIQKMGNDLLDKVNQTWNQIASAIAAIPAASTDFAPLPQAAAGLGQWELISAVAPAGLALPAGGTWAYFMLSFSNLTGAINNLAASVAAGGTNIFLGAANVNPFAMVYKILATSGDIDFAQPILLMSDGSYVVTLTGGQPYNVLPEKADFWQSIQAWLAAGNVAQPYVPPAAVAPDPMVAANANLQSLMLKYVNSIMVGPTPPLAFAAQWLAAWKAAGN
jgi:hypothetical protein